MYERHYGYLYDAKRRPQDDAKLIRSTIKTMVKAGMLPDDWKYSVRYRSFAGGCAIDVVGKSPRPIWLMNPGYYRAAPGRDRYLRLALDGAMVDCVIRAGEQWHVRVCDVETTEAKAVDAALRELHSACNHDGSESQVDYFDVKFYGVPTIDVIDGVDRCIHRSPEYLPASARMDGAR